MMWKEFEELAGYEVTYEDYHNVIEPMYMATDLSKRDFIACLDEKRFSIQYKKAQMKKSLLKEMRRLASDMKALCGHCDTYEIYIELRDKAQEYIKEFGEYGTHTEWDRGYEYSYGGNNFGCSYIKAIVFYSDYNNEEVSRVKLVA